MFENLKRKHLPGKSRLPDTAGPIVYWTQQRARSPLIANIAINIQLATSAGLARVDEDGGSQAFTGPNGEGYDRFYWALDYDAEAKLWRLRWSRTYQAAYKVRPYSRTFLKIDVLVYPEFPLPERPADLFITPSKVDRSGIIFPIPMP